MSLCRSFVCHIRVTTSCTCVCCVTTVYTVRSSYYCFIRVTKCRCFISNICVTTSCTCVCCVTTVYTVRSSYHCFVRVTKCFNKNFVTYCTNLRCCTCCFSAFCMTECINFITCACITTSTCVCCVTCFCTSRSCYCRTINVNVFTATGIVYRTCKSVTERSICICTNECVCTIKDIEIQASRCCCRLICRVTKVSRCVIVYPKCIACTNYCTTTKSKVIYIRATIEQTNCNVC